MLPTLSPRQKAVLSVSFALVLLLPSVLATHDEQTLVTGHSTFFNGSKYDECMASVAGIVRSQVMWFNDMVLAERYAGKGTYIYVTERGAPDPRHGSQVQLYSEGVTYTFTDPNGIPWTVQEAFSFTKTKIGGEVNTGNPTNQNGGGPTSFDAEAAASAYFDPMGNRTYVWIVELSAVPVYDMFAGIDPANAHTYYNFVTLIDTCKMRANATQPPVAGDPGHYNVTHDTPTELSSGYGHRNGATPHNHEAKLADIWIGKATTVISAVGFDTIDAAEWQSKWANGEGGGAAETAQDTANNPPS